MTRSRYPERFAAMLIAAAGIAGCGNHTNSIVGTWNTTMTVPQTGQKMQMTEVFNADGTHVETLNGGGASITANFTYTAKDDALTLRLVGGTVNGKDTPSQMSGLTQTLSYKLDGNTLSISQPGKDTLTLNRS